jgi:hypothetical protein
MSTSQAQIQQNKIHCHRQNEKAKIKHNKLASKRHQIRVSKQGH